MGYKLVLISNDGKQLHVINKLNCMFYFLSFATTSELAVAAAALTVIVKYFDRKSFILVRKNSNFIQVLYVAHRHSLNSP